MNFYKHYIGDFQRDTGHLSLTERGAYLALIHHYYATEKPLPNKIDALCRVAGAVTKAERDAVKAVMSFFEPMESGLVHARIEAELEKAGHVSSTNRDIAIKREAKRKADREAKNNAQNDHEQSTIRAQNVARIDDEQSTNQTPDTRHHKNPVVNKTHTEGLELVGELTPGKVCVFLTEQGIAHTNPAHVDLLEALRGGAVLSDFSFAANEAKNKGKGFAYLLKIAIGNLEKRKNANKPQKPKSAQIDSDFAEKYAGIG